MTTQAAQNSEPETHQKGEATTTHHETGNWQKTQQQN